MRRALHLLPVRRCGKQILNPCSCRHLSSTFPEKPTFILTLGLPGSGKTYSLKRRFGLEHLIILDLDKEMLQHPDYDPEDAAKIYDDPNAYAWANDAVQSRLDDLCSRAPLPPLVALDGTGTHVERQIGRIRQARAAGFHVVLLNVQISLTKALKRNLTRKRQVPEPIMRRYLKALETAVEAQLPHVDEYIIHDNEADDGLMGRQRWNEWFDLYYSRLSLGAEHHSAVIENDADLSTPLYDDDGQRRPPPFDPAIYRPSLSNGEEMKHQTK